MTLSSTRAATVGGAQPRLVGARSPDRAPGPTVGLLVGARSGDRAPGPTVGLLFLEERETCGRPRGGVRRPRPNRLLSRQRPAAAAPPGRARPRPAAGSGPPPRRGRPGRAAAARLPAGSARHRWDPAGPCAD